MEELSLDGVDNKVSAREWTGPMEMKEKEKPEGSQV